MTTALVEIDERRFPELTDQQEAFVWQYLADPSTQQGAAERAGYDRKSAHVTASRLMRNPKVIRALHEASVMTLGTIAPQAIGQLRKLGLSAKSEFVQLEASKDILDRLGMTAPKQVRVGGAVTFAIDLS